MKKQLLFIALFIFSVSIVNAQSKSSFSKGDNLFNIGVGIGSPFFGSGYSSSLPVNPSISYERGVTDAISVGGQVSYASSKYDGYNYTFKESAVYIGARGSYHFNELLNINPKFDLYGGASLGYVTVSISDNQNNISGTASGLGFGLYAGGKYYIGSSTAIYSELGYQSLSLLNIGVAFKF
ncbi:MAG: outer membrane beta-barrel protein [Sphingobacteriaceae bacterium]|nr:outer membrane beta-barrel protein [Sphingobacteriaceae bacterium]